ncbi:hypothetical protein SVIOM74S_02668 [Streptomyces violarus]
MNLAGGEAEPTLPQDMPEGDADVFVELWAEAKVYYLASVFPKYGSPAWIALPPDDPRRLASALHAAEMWRKYGDEDNLLAWFRDVSRPRPPFAEGRSRAELDALAKPKRPHQLRATPGWPPIRVPGKPGRYLTYRDTHQEAA